LLTLASSGELKSRQDVTDTLEGAGFEVVRTTKSSISIADPDGGRNIRLKGAIYEQSFNAGEGLRAATVSYKNIRAHETGGIIAYGVFCLKKGGGGGGGGG
ncbi:hypothetical protein ACVGXH_02780, partial [Enterobacter intestinihominis]